METAGRVEDRMPLDKFALLEWLVSREADEPGIPLRGGDLLSRVGGSKLVADEAQPWAAVVRTAGQLRGAGWVSWRFMIYPNQRPEPPPNILTETELQQVEDISVTTAGYQIATARQPTSRGPTIVFQNSEIGQLAMGDINNVTLTTVLEAVERQIDATEGSDAAKTEAKTVLRRLQEQAAAASTSAAGQVIAAAARSALGLP